LFSAGIRPRDELVRQSGLALGERGGIMINDYCQTSNPDIYAIGECALWQNKIYGLVAPGYDMARIAAKHVTEQTCAEFAGADMSTKLKLMGVDVASVGDAHAMTPNALSYFYADEDTQVYKKIVVNGEKTKLLGAVLVGCAKEYNDLLQMMLNGLALLQTEYADLVVAQLWH
jgi:nitrite reductase (NADH) large subunit